VGDILTHRENGILTIKEQYNIIDELLEERLENILPEIMKREAIDMWVVMAREYNEDPIFLTLIPSLQRTASRLSCLVFSIDKSNKLECLSLSRPSASLNHIYKQVWDNKSETQWECLKRIVDEKNPKKIGINTSSSFALADGITKGLYDELLSAIGSEYSERIVSAEKLCIGWLERRSQSELNMYPNIYDVAIKIIEEAFSRKVIKIGQTTTKDVEWWIMEKINSLGLKAWFSPTIDLQRKGVKENRVFDAIIMPGDILHCDVGIEYLGLCTDTQRLAYVLENGESDVPLGIKAALKNCNEFQDVVKDNFIEGRTGNEILTQSLSEATKKSIKAMLYTHPIGYHGHGVGPTIGLWDNQGQVPIWGDYPLYYDTCYALELNTASIVPEWNNQEVFIYLEETIAFTRLGVNYLKDRQTEFIII